MTGYPFTVADVAYLASAEGAAALADAARFTFTATSRLQELSHARTAWGDHAPAVFEAARLRAHGAQKIEHAARWLFTDEALQQATPTAVARHRATRLAGRRVHDVTCSVGAELTELACTARSVLGSDLDPVRVAMARTNVPGAAVFRADALTVTSRRTVVMADPARRANGSRRHDPASLQPPLPDLIAAYRGRDLVIKCAPGLDFDRLGWDGEVELVSLDGGVREACLWSRAFAENGVRRRATVLRHGSDPVCVTDAQPDDIPEREPGSWVVDPDGAIVRAGLVRHFAAANGLWQLDPRIAYLTGEAVPAGARGFRILDRFPFAERALRRALADRGCGSLEILVRGVDIDPDALRRRLKLRGDAALSAVVTRIGRSPHVFVCTPGVRGG